ncbi:integrase core domain-containing protein [Chloroflexota bacterium]
MRDDLLNREILTMLTESNTLIKAWRKESNQVRPHSALGYRLPSTEVIVLATLI